MPKFKEPEVEVKFTSNCFEAVILLEYRRGGQRGNTPAIAHFVYVYVLKYGGLKRLKDRSLITSRLESGRELPWCDTL